MKQTFRQYHLNSPQKFMTDKLTSGEIIEHIEALLFQVSSGKVSNFVRGFTFILPLL
jgi:hypothetical protein